MDLYWRIITIKASVGANNGSDFDKPLHTGQPGLQKKPPTLSAPPCKLPFDWLLTRPGTLYVGSRPNLPRTFMLSCAFGDPKVASYFHSSYMHSSQQFSTVWAYPHSLTYTCSIWLQSWSNKNVQSLLGTCELLDVPCSAEVPCVGNVTCLWVGTTLQSQKFHLFSFWDYCTV